MNVEQLKSIEDNSRVLSCPFCSVMLSSSRRSFGEVPVVVKGCCDDCRRRRAPIQPHRTCSPTRVKWRQTTNVNNKVSLLRVWTFKLFCQPPTLDALIVELLSSKLNFRRTFNNVKMSNPAQAPLGDQGAGSGPGTSQALGQAPAQAQAQPKPCPNVP